MRILVRKKRKNLGATKPGAMNATAAVALVALLLALQRPRPRPSKSLERSA